MDRLADSQALKKEKGEGRRGVRGKQLRLSTLIRLKLKGRLAQRTFLGMALVCGLDKRSAQKTEGEREIGGKREGRMPWS
jgi:hypothetical protein